MEKLLCFFYFIFIIRVSFARIFLHWNKRLKRLSHLLVILLKLIIIFTFLLFLDSIKNLSFYFRLLLIFFRFFRGFFFQIIINRVLMALKNILLWFLNIRCKWIRVIVSLWKLIIILVSRRVKVLIIRNLIVLDLNIIHSVGAGSILVIINLVVLTPLYLSLFL